MHVKGVVARKVEKARAKQLKEMTKTYNSIPHELFQPISDPEAEWKATNEVWIVEEAKKKAKKNSNVNPTNPTNDSEGEEDTTITVDEESWLQRDFVSFEMDDAGLDAENAEIEIIREVRGIEEMMILMMILMMVLMMILMMITMMMLHFKL